MKKIKKIAKKGINKLIVNYHHNIQNGVAKKTLKQIEQTKGKLNSGLKKLSKDYAHDILGWVGYAPWLYVYSAVSGDFKEGWIPDNYYGLVVVPAIKGNYGKISSFKPYTNMIFKGNLFPDIAYYVNGIWYSNNHQVMIRQKLNEFIFHDRDRIVFKVDNSLQGKGVFFFNRENFDITSIEKLGNGVIQEYINQHDFFNECTPNSVATIRMTTVFEENGNTSLRASYLKLGRKIDTHVKAGASVKVQINIKTGELHEQGYLPNWVETFRHPDTDFIFAKRKIPLFDECVKHVLDLHKMIPYVRCIGWDLIIDNNGKIIIMEWNGNHNGINFAEATIGPCFSDLGWEELWKKNK